jgi:hypothetical protein
MSSRFISFCLALTLSACATMSKPGGTTATVTGVASGRASVPAEREFVLRTATGRVYVISQVINNPPNVGDVVLIEPVDKGSMRIVGPAK